MALPNEIPVVSKRWTVGDLEDPITVKWNQALTVESSSIVIDRPEGSASIEITGNLLDAATGLFEYPWSAGDLVSGDLQLVKARLFTLAALGGRRKSTEFFKINVDGDIT